MMLTIPAEYSKIYHYAVGKNDYDAKDTDADRGNEYA